MEIAQNCNVGKTFLCERNFEFKKMKEITDWFYEFLMFNCIDEWASEHKHTCKHIHRLHRKTHTKIWIHTNKSANQKKLK